MGSDADAVVDTELRVRGVERIARGDASVMPCLPGGNTNAPTIMIAERAAELIARQMTVETMGGARRLPTSFAKLCATPRSAGAAHS